MLTRRNIQMHSGSPHLPLDQETLTAFVTTMASASIARSAVERTRSQAEERLRDEIFHTIYGTIASDLERFRDQLRDAMQSIEREPMMAMHHNIQLQRSIDDITAKTR